MKAFITKYALTDGIKEIESDGGLDSFGGISFRSEEMGYRSPTFYGKRDFETTRELAIKKAEAMRTKRIASLKKQIAKLEAMKFE